MFCLKKIILYNVYNWLSLHCYFLDVEGFNGCEISIYSEKGVNSKSICTFCLSDVKKKTSKFKTELPKSCQNTPSKTSSDVISGWHPKSENSNFIYHCASVSPPVLSYYPANINVNQIPQEDHYSRYH